MASELATPTDIVWTSNGEVAEIEQWCIDRVRTLGIDDSPSGRALVAFMSDKLEASGPGMYGFSAVEPPFDDLGCRRLLARLVAELAHELLASRSDPQSRWRTFHERLSAGGEPWHLAAYLANLERFHTGIVRSFAGDAPPELALGVTDPLRAAIDLCRWAPIWRDWRYVREKRIQWIRPYDAEMEVDALDRLISAARRLLAAGWTPARAPHPLSTMSVMLGNRAELLERLGRRAEAAESWRQLAAVEADSATAATALAIAARLERDG